MSRCQVAISFALVIFFQRGAVEAGGDASPHVAALLSISPTSGVVNASPTVALISNSLVQEELGVSQAQVAVIRKITVQGILYQVSLSPTPPWASALFPENLPARLKALDQARVSASADSQRQVEGVLDHNQIVRLRQIQIQLGGHNSFVDADVAKFLGLSKVSNKKLAIIVADVAVRINAELKGLGSEESRRKFIRQQTEKAVVDCTAVLNEDQLEKWRRLRGDLLKFNRDDLVWYVRMDSPSD